MRSTFLFLTILLLVFSGSGYADIIYDSGVPVCGINYSAWVNALYEPNDADLVMVLDWAEADQTRQNYINSGEGWFNPSQIGFAPCWTGVPVYEGQLYVGAHSLMRYADCGGSWCADYIGIIFPRTAQYAGTYNCDTIDTDGDNCSDYLDTFTEEDLDILYSLGNDPNDIKIITEPKICPKGKVGNPVSIFSGNNIETSVDLSFPFPWGDPLTLKRYYNSKYPYNGRFGKGWLHSYEVDFNNNVQVSGNTYLRIIDETGRGVYFQDQGDGVYAGAFNEQSYVKAESGLYIWYRLDGRRFYWNSSNQLYRIVDTSGNNKLLTYENDGSFAGMLLKTITDEASGSTLTLNYNNEKRIVSIIGPVIPSVPDGIWAEYGYDADGNLTSVTYADGSGFDYEYNDLNDVHNLTAKKDKQEHLLSSWTYDSQDRVTSNFTRDGTGVDINYVSETEVKVTDAYGVEKTYTLADVNGHKKVTDITNPAGCTTCGDDIIRMEYDNQGRIIEVEYANGLIYQMADFDSKGDAQTVTQAVGTSNEKTILYTLHPKKAAKLSQTEPSLLGAGSKVTIWDYDDDGNDTPNENPTRQLYRLVEQGFTEDASGQIVPYEKITTYTYNTKGQVLSIDGPQPGPQDMTTFSYDDTSPTSDLLAVTRPLTGTVTYSNYDAAGQPGRITDENGHATILTYDGKGRIKTAASESDGSVTTYTYNTAGELDQVISANGVTTDFEYDSTYGRLVRMLDPLGNYMSYDYDAQGNRIDQSIYTAAVERTFRQRFDYQSPQNPGKLWKTINPDDTFTEYSYFAGGNIASIKDPADKTTGYDYDILNRLTSVTQPGNVITLYDYDANDNLKTVTDAEGHTTLYTYDDDGRLLSTTSPDTGVTTYAYDISGNLTSKTDAKGITTTYTYDTLNRLTGIIYPDVSQNIGYTYDEGTNGKDRLTGMSDPSGTTAYAYDAKGNLISETRTIGGAAYTTSYTYDAAGTLTGMTYPDGRSVTYELDSAGRVNRVTSTKNATTQTLAENISYKPFGPIAGLSYGNGTNLTQNFDLLYRPSDIAAGSVYNVAFAKDAVGNITGITDNLDAARNQSFGYDDLYRLTSATGVYGTIGYTYDDVGNRLTRTHDGQTDTYSYDTGTNRLSQITGADPQSFTLDANGNTTAMGAKTLVYNQNNRLIQAAENADVLADYTYNGNGQRVIKASDGSATVYHYDSFGNLIGESSLAGVFSSQFVYLNGIRLAAIGSSASAELTVQVNTSQGANLAGVSVYAFTEAGAYTGISAVTGEDGKAVFDAAAFTDGSYKFRADYLSSQFWSDVITLPGTAAAAIQIAEETATLQVTQGGAPKAGVKVYLFNDSGAYLGLYQTTDENGNVSFDLPAGKQFKFRADVLGGQFFSEVVTITAGGPNNFAVATGGGVLTVALDSGGGTPMAGVSTFLFSESGAYLGLNAQTDAQGEAGFSVPGGNYKIRADYLGYQFWTNGIAVSTSLTESLSIPHQDVVITVNGDHNGDVIAREGLPVYLFTSAGASMGQNLATDTNGQVTFSLPAQEYKVRVDYLTQQFWSDGFVQADQTVTIPECEARITITRLNNPLSDVPVYVFNSAGSYLSLTDTTAANGQTAFRLPAGDYNFRADYLSSQYFSGNTTLIADQVNPVTVSTGGGNFTLTVQKATDNPMVGVNCFLFSAAGAYLGHQTATSAQGEAPFELADGDYKIRIDYMGYQFWTADFTVPDTATLTHTIDHQDVTLTVQRDYNGDVVAGEGVSVYLFTAAGTYMNHTLAADANGQVVFSLPTQDYKVRADYLNGQYWSDVFNQTDQTITINEGMARISVSQGSTLLENVPVYVYTANDVYLNINALTDTDGVVEFILPAGTYKFRADYQGEQYWATQAVDAHIVNDVALNTGGGTFVLTVEKAPGSPLESIPVYVFSSAGSYLGITQQTDADGQVSFDLSDGEYQFRADYLGYQFWSNIVEVPGTLSDVLTIVHQDVTITVNETYQSSTTPLESINVYLFTSGGAYQSINAAANAQGQVTFNLPAQDYKVRADYLGGQYWSDVFNQTNVNIDIAHGYANVHVTETGIDIYNAPVYLFTDTGSYLGRVINTDSASMSQFLIPAGSYKFRVDYNGTQYWSDVVNVLADEETVVELQLDLLAMDLTNDPNPVRFDGTPPEFKPEPVLLASLFDITGILARSVVANTGQDAVYYYINDHLGTPQKVIDGNSNVVWSADYQPFGNVNISMSDVENNFRFAGQSFDQETGLHYNHHRYYSPNTGRYIRPDPIGLAGMDPNLYGYVRNNPVIFVDPEGLWFGPYLIQLAQRVAPYLARFTPYTPAASKVVKDVFDQSGPSVTTGIQELYHNYSELRLKEEENSCEDVTIESTELSPEEIAAINKKASLIATEIRYRQLINEMKMLRKR